MFALKAAYIIIFESYNSIFLPDKILNKINYNKIVIAYTYRLRLLVLLPSKIKMTSFLSDGLNSQFKSLLHCIYRWTSQKYHNVEITWNIFATSHGKDQVDGTGGSVKCHMFDKVLSNQYQMDSASIFVIAAQNMPHIKVFKMKSAEIN